MSEKNVEVNVVCTFAGQSMNANGTTSVSFGARYDELANVMQLCHVQFTSVVELEDDVEDMDDWDDDDDDADWEE